jgi:hypothetical protein
MNNNKDTFCAAPWFQVRNNNNMSKAVCCSVSHEITEHIPSQNMSSLEYLNSQPIRDLKKDLANGVRSTHCRLCWMQEENGIQSLRQDLNSLISMQEDINTTNWMDVYFSKKNNFDSDMIVSADIKVGNTCNYACVMCVPEDSSLIYANWMASIDHPVVQRKLATDPDYLAKAKSFTFKNKQYIKYLDDILKNNKHIKFLKFIGGETFLDKFLIDKLRQLPDSTKSKLSLLFVTNASKDFSAIIDSLGDFKYIQCSVSLEGIGEVQEWARYGSNWQEVEQHVLKAVDNPRIDMAVLYTLQTATVLGFRDLATWCRNNNIKLKTNIVDNPVCLGMKTLPDHIKKSLLKDIEINRNIIDNTETTYENLLVGVNDSKFDQDLRDDFFEYIEWYETDKNIKKLKTIFPELFVE